VILVAYTSDHSTYDSTLSCIVHVDITCFGHGTVNFIGVAESRPASQIKIILPDALQLSSRFSMALPSTIYTNNINNALISSKLIELPL